MLKCLFKKFASLRPAALFKGDSNKVFFLENFAKFFRTPVLHLIIECYAKNVFQKIPQISRQNSCERLLLVLVRIGFVWPAAILLIICSTDCKSVFKILSLSTEIQSSTDLKLMSTQSMY